MGHDRSDYRSNQIEKHASSVISSYSTNAGLNLFKAIRNIKDQEFKQFAPDYYKWLLAAVPAGYQECVNKRVQELRADLRTRVDDLMHDPSSQTRIGFQTPNQETGYASATDDAVLRDASDQDEYDIIMKGAREHAIEIDPKVPNEEGSGIFFSDRTQRFDDEETDDQ